MPVKSKYKLTKAEEKKLREKLTKTIMTMIAIIGFLTITILFFAPKLGVFFGFFSKHKNEKETENVIKPNAPILTNVPKATKEDKISINGFAQAGSTINLFLNGPMTATTTTSSDGQFTFNDVGLIDGTNTFFARTTDTNGIESEPSITYTVKVDKNAPIVTIETPKNDETIKNLDKRIQVKGKISEKATIKINDRMAIQRPDYSFDFLLGVNDTADIEIKIEVTDEAGNTKTEKIKVKYIRGS